MKNYSFLYTDNKQIYLTKKKITVLFIYLRCSQVLEDDADRQGWGCEGESYQSPVWHCSYVQTGYQYMFIFTIATGA